MTMTHHPTQSLATFAAELDPDALPDAVREKLGWLLLDYLRVASLGSRLPWAAWARRYADVVAKPGAAQVLFAPNRLNPQHATFVNVAFGSSFDADDQAGGLWREPRGLPDAPRAGARGICDRRHRNDDPAAPAGGWRPRGPWGGVRTTLAP